VVARKEERDRSFYDPIVEETKLILHGFDDPFVHEVRRTRNGVGKDLAKEGCEDRIGRSLFGVPRASIVKNLVSYVSVI
jgi:hypothetical protein